MNAYMLYINIYNIYFESVLPCCNVNYGPSSTIMCQHKLIDCNESIIMVQDVHSGKKGGFVEKESSIWNSLYFPLNLAVNLKLL